jgi:ABC-type multidrug transport system fused ATPase/permease subunit
VFAFALFLPMVEFLGSLATALLLWYGGVHLLAGDTYLTFGILAAFIQASQRFFQPIRDLADKFNIMQTAMTASERVFNLMDTHDVIPQAENPVQKTIKGKVEFRNVWFAYNDDEWILKDVSFQVKPGNMVALVGATGSGKSTIINLLFRFYDIQKGEILIDGINIKQFDIKNLRQQMGLVLQDIFLFSGDITQNISLNREGITEDDVYQAAKAVQVDHFVKKMPQGYQTEVKERGSTLSLGQRQLLSFARALAINPQVLVLDEATSSVDTETEHLIQQALETVMAGRTNIIVAHRLSTVQRADEILVLHQGEVVEQGTHQELLQHEGRYWQLYQLQYKEQFADEAELVASQPNLHPSEEEVH